MTIASVAQNSCKRPRVDQINKNATNIYSLPDELLGLIFSYNELLDKHKAIMIVNPKFRYILSEKNNEKILAIRGLALSPNHLKIVRFYKKLKELDLSGCYAIRKSMDAVSKDHSFGNEIKRIFQLVERLNLSMVDLSADLADILKYFENLRELNVSGNWDCMSSLSEEIEDNQGLQQLFGKLKNLNVSSTGMDAKGMSALKFCINLEGVNISCNPAFAKIFEEPLGEELKHIFAQLKTLDVSKIELTPNALFNIFSYCESLEELTISDIVLDLVAWLQDERNQIISTRLKNLRILNLPGVVLTEKDLEFFKSFTNLRIRS